MDEIFDKLTEYTLSLKKALEATSEANERPLLTQHLAAAAEMFALPPIHGNVSVIENIVKTEIRNHGWSYITGTAGEMVAEKWVAFTNATGFQS